MFRLPTLTLAAVMLLAACSDRRDPISPRAKAPALGIWDGAHEGNKDFFFLPPMAADPSADPDFDAGKFNAELAPIVSICLLDQLTASTCDSEIKVFDAVTVSVTEEMYHVNWNTSESGLLLDRLYRISVIVGTEVVGYIDVDPVNSGKELRAVNTNEYIGLVDGKTLPIKFRIEQGVTCENKSDCVEQAVTNTGGIVVTNTGYAGVDFPAGWLPVDPSTGKPYTNVTVKIERVAVGIDNICHADLALMQFEGCYEFTTDPDVGVFAQPVVAGICSELSSTDPLYHHQAFYTSGVGELTKEAPEAEAPFIDCTGFAGTPVLASNLGRVNAGLFAFVGHVGKLLSPKPLYAIDLGVGGELVEFSRGGWAIPATVVIQQGDGQNGMVGTTLANQLIVKVVGGHSGHGVPNFKLTFTPSSGTISLPNPVVTNSDGVAVVNWTLGTAAGAQTVSIAGKFSNSATITANAIAPVANVTLTPTRIDFGLSQTGVPVQISTKDAAGNPVAPQAACLWAVTSNRGFMAITQSGMLSSSQADDGVVTATCDGITGSALVESGDFQFTATATISDPTGDAGTSAGGSPDLTGFTVSIADRQVTFSASYSSASVNAVTAKVGVSVDTDQNPSTGHPGVNASGTMDNGIISADYLINIEGLSGQLYKYAGTLNAFTPVGSALACSTGSDGVTTTYSCTFSLSQLGYDDGYLNFKGAGSAKLVSGGYSGILDVITDLGQAVGSTGYVVP